MENNFPNIENYKQNFNFLTEIYEVMKSFENNPSKLGSKINELKAKFEKARALLENIPGIDMSHSEQLEYHQNLLKQYKKENELLNSYKEICKFDITKLENNSELTNGDDLKSQDMPYSNNKTQQNLNSNDDFQQIYNSDMNLDDLN
ncbi:unnamed protein product [Brachionus calyciflorus]|uniref:Mediator of RNA polymerase II transcription subunit 9 n=1 Tax=Brachionus calyciflorus TaxID=104777 RepID=A0A813VWR6_9BILA|nr:unnamed protein product [Brachionus calyciflorus]